MRVDEVPRRFLDLELVKILYFYSLLFYNIKKHECWLIAIGWPRSSGETGVVAPKTWQSCEWLTSLRKPTVGLQVSPLPMHAPSLSEPSGH